MRLYTMWKGRRFFCASQGEFDTSFFSENNRIILIFMISLLIGFISGKNNFKKCFPQKLVSQESDPFISPPYNIFLIEHSGKGFVSYEKTK